MNSSRATAALIFGLQQPHETFPAARTAAERALALNDALAQANTVLGEVRKFYEWDWAGAERAYRRAIEIDPHSLIALGLGEIEAALTGLEDAYAARTPRMLAAGDPFFSELATESRYRELMTRLRLPVQG